MIHFQYQDETKAVTTDTADKRVIKKCHEQLYRKTFDNSEMMEYLKKNKKTKNPLPQLIQCEMNNLNTLKYLIQINFQKILKARWFHRKILPRNCK